MTRLRVPDFVYSIRFRLTVMYSTLLFALAALVLGGIYLAVSRSTEAQPITKTYRAEKVLRDSSGSEQVVGQVDVVKVQQVEQAVNYQTMQNLRTYSLGMLGGLFVASLGIGWMLSGRALRPVRAIARTAEDIQATDLSRRIKLGGPRDELRYLGDTVDSMLDRIDRAFRAERQFVDDASHELRTPLSIIRANVDAVLTAPDATDDERRRAALVVDRATTRMTQLVDDLLATARRSGNAFHDTDVDLGKVVHEAADEYEPLAAERGLTIARAIQGGLLTIGDHDALRRAVGNLLSNAVRLTPTHTTLTVAAGRNGTWLWAAVSDAGPGIPDADQLQVFDRFWRSADGDSGSRRTGLGLAIVRQIVEAHGGHVRLFSAVGEGSTFVMWLAPRDGSGAGGPPEGNPLVARSTG
ncbi:MAG: HAMP domain-containing protein [Streptosporangiales bacterium]|nr:HAMP domain-containing protein [Streptosporangiales bacterium]